MKVLIIAIGILLFASCQKNDIDVINFRIECINIDLEYSLEGIYEPETYVKYSGIVDTSFTVYRNDKYTAAVFLPYKYHFIHNIHGEIKITMSVNGVIVDEEINSGIKCYSKYGFLQWYQH